MTHETKQKEETHGTSLVAIRYASGVVLAADSQISRGILKSSYNSDKIVQISPDPSTYGAVFVMGSGTSSHIQVVTRIVFNYLTYLSMELQEKNKLQLESVVQIYKNICYGNKKFIRGNFIISDGKRIFAVKRDGSYFGFNDFAAAGSGSQLMLGLLEGEYREQMSYLEAHDLALKCLR